MKFIPLERKFIEWNNEPQPDLEIWQPRGMARGWLTWDQILASKRTVILAEGGSGKSTELLSRHRLLDSQGKYSFLLTVKKVGARGLEDSLLPKERSRFAQWRESDHPAWIFVDSVDEAKAGGVPLAEALSHIADAIEGAEARAHVVLSGRPTEWEYRKDLHAVMELLPPPSANSALDTVDFEASVVQAIDQSYAPPPTLERHALIVIMAPLDNHQVEKFARGQDIKDTSEFLQALENESLRPFTRRPADLDWLSRYWLTHRKFDCFERMLETNLTERLTETNLERARGASLDIDKAMQAAERVGAALVLSRIRDVIIDDRGNLAAPSDGLRLREVLPDLSPALQRELLGAAIFVPSLAGLARLQNDNNGVVRSYLAARWLRRMLKHNCPWSAARDLLFAETYGVLAVKPSMVAVAAWLSIWEPRAAEELIKRQPYALVEHGDPASLPLATRRSALRAILKNLDDMKSISFSKHDGLMRFATADMQQEILDQWAALRDFPELETQRQLLLRFIAEGKLRDCVSLAFEAGVARGADSLTRALAVQALVAAGDNALRAQYEEFLRREARSLHTDFVWSATRLLFPVAVTVDDLIAILPKLVDDERRAGHGLDFYGPRLAQQVDRPEDARKLLRALLERLPQTAQAIADFDREGVTNWVPAIASLANRLLDLDSAPHPDPFAVDALLRLTALTWRHGWREEELIALGERMRLTAERRRNALWQLCQSYATLDVTLTEPLSDLVHLHVARFNPGVGMEDLDWLIRDARSRSELNERMLALHLAMSVWLQNGKPDTALFEIKAAATSSRELSVVVESWINPPAPSPERMQLDETEARYTAENQARETKRKASWISFVEDIRANPARLDILRPPDEQGVDYKLYHVWQLFDSLGRDSQGRSMSDIALLKPIFGQDALPYIRSAFVRYWRLGNPKLRSERRPEDYNLVTAMDRIGLIGVSVEAADDANWARRLDDDEAALATVYATLELNQFPRWFDALASIKPAPVRATLRRAFAGELTSTSVNGSREVLERIANSSNGIAMLVAADIMAAMSETTSLPLEALRVAIRIARRGASDQIALLASSLSRGRAMAEPKRVAVYLACAFAIDGDSATSALTELTTRMDLEEQAELGLALLPAIMGSDRDFGRERAVGPALSTESLVKLTRFAFRAVRPSEDIDRSNGSVYSPNIRDDAQSARDALLKLMAETPGAATYRALRQLESDPDFPLRKNWLRQLVQERVEKDSESAPWTARDVKAFEDDFDTVPRSPQDLQRVAMSRIEDLQHRLVHSDFGLGVQFKALEREVDVQRWVAGALQDRQSRSYTLEREPHVAEEKEPDIRLSSKGSDARLPIEIKVAESWSFNELVEALDVQLRGRYLRDRTARWGVLLLAHQDKRPEGWQPKPGESLSFEETVKRLQALAAEISAADSQGPQMQVGVMDVSSIKSPRAKTRSTT